jgi:uncharacterized protein YneF (UPF0154 family)
MVYFSMGMLVGKPMFIEAIAILLLFCCAGSSFFLHRTMFKTLEKNPDKNNLPK